MRKSLMSQLNKMVKIIREKRAVSFGEMCMAMNLSPSTIYQYARVMRFTFLDIEFEDQVFKIVKRQSIEELTGQEMLHS